MKCMKLICMMIGFGLLCSLSLKLSCAAEAGESAVGAADPLEEIKDYSCIIYKIPSAKNEDRCVVRKDPVTQRHFFGVFDGHKGAGTVEYLTKSLHEKVFSATRSDISFDGISKAFVDTNQQFLDQMHLDDASGSTATMVLLDAVEHMFYVAWVGDSPALLVHKNGLFEKLTDPLHEPDVPEEKQRIEAAGGFVERGRVKGWLNMSRSFGEMHLKGFGVIAKPDVVSRRMVDGDYVVMMSDGVSDVVETQLIADLVVLNGDNIAQASKEIAECAVDGWKEKYMRKQKKHADSAKKDHISRGHDDITLLIVKFGSLEESSSLSSSSIND